MKRRSRKTRTLSKLSTLPTRRPMGILTPAQENRVRLMREANLNLSIIADSLIADGVDITRQAVSDQVTRGRWTNVTRKRAGSRADLIIEKFCNLTGTTRAEAWPDLLHEGEDETNPVIIDRINRARGRINAESSSEAEERRAAAGE
jgi:hypothetical protein